MTWPDAWHGRVAAVTFNLGYLPGGDRRVVTQPGSSSAAIGAAARLLRADGIMTIVAYRGHPGGRDEADAVAIVCDRLANSGFAVDREAAPADGPVLWVVRAPVG